MEETVGDRTPLRSRLTISAIPGYAKTPSTSSRVNLTKALEAKSSTLHRHAARRCALVRSK